MGQGGEVGGAEGGVTRASRTPIGSLTLAVFPLSGRGYVYVPVNTGLRFSMKAARPSL